MIFKLLEQCNIIYGNLNRWSKLINRKFKFKKFKDKYITIIITATKVKAIHIPYPTPAPPHTHTQGHCHLPSILPYSCGGYSPLGPTAPPQWRDAHI